MTIQQDSTHLTGVSDDSLRGGSEASRARARKARAALTLRQQAYTWDQVAETLGYPTPRAALVATEQALEAELKDSESQAFMRNMASRRYDRLLRAVWDKAIDPNNPDHLQAVDRVRAIMRDHADLHGYQAPKQQNTSSPTAADLQAWVAGLLGMKTEELDEADIFEAEVVPEERALDAAPAE